ncbi:hypothetical protein GGR56DRAFT_675921 [Xylariaceae sp. FL0804]|nr:hypothetical protein GGR56DRAFT_675921 [Xylariaceae sp. FL0804]
MSKKSALKKAAAPPAAAAAAPEAAAPSSSSSTSPSSPFRPKLPLAQRLDPLIGPGPVFDDVEAYFHSLLRIDSRPPLTLDAILDAHFSPYELVRLRAAGPPLGGGASSGCTRSLVAGWQRDAAERYDALLSTRFKDTGGSSLQRKLAFLWFGLPVEPLRPGNLAMQRHAAAAAGGMGGWDDDVAPPGEPQGKLAFLDTYASKQSSSGLKFAEPVASTTAMLHGGGYSAGSSSGIGLRGGGGEGEPMDIGEDFFVDPDKEEEDAVSEAASAEQAKWGAYPLPPPSKRIPYVPPMPSKGSPEGFRIYGYQGSAWYDCSAHRLPLKYAPFAAAVGRVLNRRDEVDYEVRLEVWDVEADEPVGTYEGMVHFGYEASRRGHGKNKAADSPDDDDDDDDGKDPVWAAMKRYFKPDKYGALSGKYACFVHGSREERPDHYEPRASTDPYVVRFWDFLDNGVAYMRVPAAPREEHMPHQYLGEYVRMMRMLRPNMTHHLNFFYYGGPKDDYCYGLLDAPQQLWPRVREVQREAGKRSSNKDDTVPTVRMDLATPDNPDRGGGEEISRDTVPVFMQGCVYGSWLSKKDLTAATGRNGDAPGLAALFENFHTNAEDYVASAMGFAGIEVWCSSHRFMDLSVEPTFLEAAGAGDGDPHRLYGPAALSAWRGLMESGLSESARDSTAMLSMAVRPRYRQYRLRVPGGKGFAPMPHDADLRRFRQLVKASLYKGYDARDPLQVLHLRMVSDTLVPKNRLEFVLRHDATQADWETVMRRISEPDIEISVKNWDNAFNVPTKTVWGARYDRLKPREWTNARGSTTGRKFDGLFGGPAGSSSSASGRAGTLPGWVTRPPPAAKPSWYDQYSIFSNPAKPALPAGGAPPLERMLRVGPGVPGVSIAVMTPTETLRLQREVHNLRAQLLGRERPCPYRDCDASFPADAWPLLTEHVAAEHAALRCFLCAGGERRKGGEAGEDDAHLLPYYNEAQLRRHFAERHLADVRRAFPDDSRDLLRLPEEPYFAPTLPHDEVEKLQARHYCHRCGRDQRKTSDPWDVDYHQGRCYAVDLGGEARARAGGAKRYCTACGLAQGSEEPCTCGRDGGHPLVHCGTCGMDFFGTMTLAYRQMHVRECRTRKEHNAFCPHCRAALSGLSPGLRAEHVERCESRPQEEEEDEEATRTTPSGRAKKTKRAGRGEHERMCPYFKHCGAPVTYMSEPQLRTHIKWHKEQGHEPEDKYFEAPNPEKIIVPPKTKSSTHAAATKSSASSADKKQPKRKRAAPAGGAASGDGTWRMPRRDAELEEEFSEVSAVSDPVANLDPNAPRSPRKRQRRTGAAAAAAAKRKSKSPNPQTTINTEGAARDPRASVSPINTAKLGPPARLDVAWIKRDKSPAKGGKASAAVVMPPPPPPPVLPTVAEQQTDEEEEEQEQQQEQQQEPEDEDQWHKIGDDEEQQGAGLFGSDDDDDGDDGDSDALLMPPPPPPPVLIIPEQQEQEQQEQEQQEQKDLLLQSRLLQQMLQQDRQQLLQQEPVVSTTITTTAAIPAPAPSPARASPTRGPGRPSLRRAAAREAASRGLQDGSGSGTDTTTGGGGALTSTSSLSDTPSARGLRARQRAAEARDTDYHAAASPTMPPPRTPGRRGRAARKL